MTELLCVFSKVLLFPCSFSSLLLCTNVEALILSISKILLGEAGNKITSSFGLLTVHMSIQLGGKGGGGKRNNYPPNIRI